ncbi:sigma-54 dependent transcriptional regulator [Pseudomonas asiatica]|uniref:Sigma-54-dependent Fis family transcriptional regulator n=1 Tax=Pseudomonas monteilii TaxID=76759 RepID=A0A2N1IMZ7_9PSED|nr:MULTISPECIES: sigma-54 dependent transcriptional regulator [Pseudomonas]PKI19628.1 sigma-54-dependent Fis family transcriptional regulator [Pseudomonas monteilii]RPD93850.1 sigma-54-dependent Fis family transcriptional regulator [Pseudomonas monteilii]WDM87361.1 sigma-54 dependent transcriptional regulator [Pseudomonas asiatica]
MSTADSLEKTLWKQSSVLIVDDEEGIRSFLIRALENRCGSVAAAASVEEAATLIGRSHFDLIILDINLPGKTGLEWLQALRESGFIGDVILITAFADIETAIGALRAGAFDFILKPFRIDQLLNSVTRCFDSSRLARENFVLRREVRTLSDYDGVVVKSPRMRELYALIERLAPLPSTVLIHGESGTGKELVARALHQLSNRAQEPFVPLNCSAISAELMESELFGHVKGAFTGAAEQHKGLFFYAQGGTLFLDEIGEMPLQMQAKLLRVLEEKKIRPVGSEREVPVDVRVIAATNRDLSSEVAVGRFRQDLFYRLDVVKLTIPPLRDRPEDIPPLVDYFCKQLPAQLGIPPITLTNKVMERLSSYDWPGNVRELRNLIERSLILGYFPLDSWPERSAASNAAKSMELPESEASDMTLEAVEKRHILNILRSVSGNKSEAARKLGLSRKTLIRKCELWETH